MDFKDIFKKFWFVMLIGLVFLVYVVVLIVQTVQAQPYEVKGLEKDGQAVVYTVDDDTYYFADDLYNDLYDMYGMNDVWMSFYKSVVRNGVETTDTLNNYASYLAQYYLSNGDTSSIDSSLKSYGYSGGIDDLTAYFLDQSKVTQLLSDWLIAHYDEYVAPVVETSNPKKISQILIKVADVTETENADGTTTHTANPTEDEQKKLDDVLAALESGEDFADVAEEYSDDSSASNGGLLGIVTTESVENYVTEFKDECLAIQPGETSEVITTSYGYHIIKCEEPAQDELTSDTSFISEIKEVYPNVELQCIMDKADELGYVLYDETLKEEIDLQLNSGSEE